jgi:gliding motility-associated transport system ATP-binding protein
MIHIENLKKYYGKFPAVDDISFDVARGEILGFLGPNGAGKSTTMKVITGYYPPNAGKITIDGHDVTEESLITREMIGYLPETTPLYLDLTVYEYLKHVAEVRRIPKNLQKQRIKKMVDVTGLGDRLDQDIGKLSKGYRQRVGLAQAMLHEPKVLVLDEPTIGLDPNQIVEIRQLIKTIGEERTVILSTHILPEVQATCDRVVIIHEGKLVANGTPDELQHRFQGKPVIYLEVHGDGADDLEKVKALHGVETVERLADPELNVINLQISTEPGTDPRGDIYRLCVEQNWTLLGMNRKVESLENIFRSLTRTDAAASVAAEVAA